jgi:hypothetical protein
MKKRWIWAVLLSLILFGMVLLVAPIYGVNIQSNATTGSSDTGGSFGQLRPLSVYGYSGGN